MPRVVVACCAVVERLAVAAYWAGVICMDLPEDQRRVLDEIEQHLAQESPHLVEEFERRRVSLAPSVLVGALLAVPVGLFTAAFGRAAGSTILVACGLGLAVVVPTLIIGWHLARSHRW